MSSLIEKHDFLMTLNDFCKRKILQIAPRGVELTTFCSPGRHANPHAMNVLNGGMTNLRHHKKMTVRNVQEIFPSLDISHVHLSGDKEKVIISQFLISNFLKL